MNIVIANIEDAEIISEHNIKMAKETEEEIVSEENYLDRKKKIEKKN